MSLGIVVVGLVAAACAPIATTFVDTVPTADFGGRTYVIGVGRGLVVDDASLRDVGLIDRADDPRMLLDRRALAIAGVPQDRLVLARSAPGLADDAGPWGPYLILWSDLQEPIPQVCPFFASQAPTWCSNPAAASPRASPSPGSTSP